VRTLYDYTGVSRYAMEVLSGRRVAGSPGLTINVPVSVSDSGLAASLQRNIEETVVRTLREHSSVKLGDTPSTGIRTPSPSPTREIHRKVKTYSSVAFFSWGCPYWERRYRLSGTGWGRSIRATPEPIRGERSVVWDPEGKVRIFHGAVTNGPFLPAKTLTGATSARRGRSRGGLGYPLEFSRDDGVTGSFRAEETVTDNSVPAKSASLTSVEAFGTYNVEVLSLDGSSLWRSGRTCLTARHPDASARAGDRLMALSLTQRLPLHRTTYRVDLWSRSSRRLPLRYPVRRPEADHRVYGGNGSQCDHPQHGRLCAVYTFGSGQSAQLKYVYTDTNRSTFSFVAVSAAYLLEASLCEMGMATSDRLPDQRRSELLPENPDPLADRAS